MSKNEAARILNDEIMNLLGAIEKANVVSNELEQGYFCYDPKRAGSQTMIEHYYTTYQTFSFILGYYLHDTQKQLEKLNAMANDEEEVIA